MLSYFTSPDEPRWTRWLLLCFIPLLLLYYVAAKGNSEAKNHDVYANDQKVYLNTAAKIAADPIGYYTPRQRTPGYAYFLSMFYSEDKFAPPEGSKLPFDLAWFERGKAVNLWLSIFLLAGLFLFLWRGCLPLVEAALVTVASGLLLFTFKAGYVQPELSYWVLNTILFVLLGKMLFAPTWGLAVACGLLSVATYFVKAGTQPLLFLFAVTWVLKLLWDRFYRKGEGGWVPAAQGALVVVIFVVLLIPYCIGTKKRFGKYLYSTYTEYMMWLPMEDEEKFLASRDYMWAFYYSSARSRPITVDEFNVGLERAVRSRVKKENKGLSAEELDQLAAERFVPAAGMPTRDRYFARYPLISYGVPRVGHGLMMMNKRVHKYYDRAMEMFAFTCKLVLAGLLIRALMWGWARYRGGRKFPVEDLSPPGGSGVLGLLARRPYVFFYVAGFFCGYLVLYAWYDALGIGPRLVLSLYVPALLCAIMALQFVFRGLAVPGLIAGKPLYLGKVANVLLLIFLAYLSIRLMDGELYRYPNTGV